MPDTIVEEAESEEHEPCDRETIRSIVDQWLALGSLGPRITLTVDYDYNHDRVSITGQRQPDGSCTWMLTLASWSDSDPNA